MISYEFSFVLNFINLVNMFYINTFIINTFVITIKSEYSSTFIVALRIYPNNNASSPKETPGPPIVPTCFLILSLSSIKTATLP